MDENKFLLGVNLFNDRKFFECHDIFEETWMSENGEDADFFRGLIHLAVGCYHTQNGNFRGAKSQLIKGTQRLTPYKPVQQGINISELVESFRRIILDIERVVQGKITSDQISQFPKIHFENRSV